MKIYMIALKTSSDRIDFQRKQLDSLGLEVEFFDAITPDQLPSSKPETYWQQWERPIKLTERACFFSHFKLWEKIASSNEPALILEDDVIISSFLPEFIRRAVNVIGVDHLTLESRGKKKLLSRKSKISIGNIHLHRLYSDRAGAAGYILWPEGAHKLIDRSNKGAALADALISQLHALRSFQSVPALLYQAECSEIFSRVNPLPTASTVSSYCRIDPKGSGVFQFVQYKYRRIRTQLTIGWRILLFFSLASQSNVNFLD